MSGVYRDKIGTADIVRGFGWRYNAFPAAGPRKEDLDALWPDIPVVLIGIDGHGAWVNSQALALAGVTKDTKDPIPGFSYFQRDPATGEPTGFLVEPPVMLQVNNAVQPFSLDYVAGGLAEWLPKAAAAGITTVIGCHWANYRDFFGNSLPQSGGLTRRDALRRGALFTASAVAASAVAPPFVAEAGAAPDSSADIVFRNGPVYTVDANKPWARAVAVKGKRIVYVGDEAGGQTFVGPQSRVVDLAGKMLLPGFIEGHIHPLVGATLTRGADLQFNTREDIIKALRKYRDKVGKAAIIRGFGWRYIAFPATGPRKEDLDALWPDVPVILIAIDGHCAWVNSQALALAGVTKDTKDPLPGFSYFEREPATGEPTGYLVEVPAIIQVNNAVEPFSRDYVAEGLAEWLPKAAAAGITTVFDAGMQVIPDPEGFAIYADLERKGKLPFRVVGSYLPQQPEH